MTDYLLSISIHALREEGDARSEFRLCITLRFLSTPSARRATVPLMVFQTPHTDFYPRPPRGGRQEPMKASVRHRLFLSTPSARRATGADEGIRQAQAISIHALREEGDRRSMTSPGIPLNFYPRPPRGGRPHRRLPVWLVLCHFYPRPPRGGRLRLLSSSWIWPAISIHALREEGDQPRSYDEILNDLFLSTPSARRATIPFRLFMSVQ